MTRIRALIKYDIKNISRDPLLIYLLLFPFIALLGVELIVPRITTHLAPKFDLVPYYPLILAYFFVLIPPLTFGAIGGFTTIDERDSDVLSAVRIAPISMQIYFGYRIISEMLLCYLLMFACLTLCSLVSVSAIRLVWVLLISALGAPLWVLFLVGYANNKVEAFALVKIVAGLLLLGPIVSHFIPTPWKYLFGLLPTYWPFRAFIHIIDNNTIPWGYLTAGAVYHLALFFILLVPFRKKLSL